MIKSEIKACAISYDISMNAPELSGYGQGKHAQEMLNICRKYNVPIQKNKTLTEKLSSIPIKSQIPEDLYKEVACIFVKLVK